MRNVWEWDDIKRAARRPWRLVGLLIHNIKYSWQRMTKGYCDKDLWNLDLWFLSVIPAMLQQFKDTKHGSPAILGEEYVNEEGCLCNDSCHEEWDKILDEMIFLFREMDEETSQKNKEREEDWENYQEECKNKAFALFSKWFFYLWD